MLNTLSREAQMYNTSSKGQSKLRAADAPAAAPAMENGGTRKQQLQVRICRFMNLQLMINSPYYWLIV